MRDRRQRAKDRFILGPRMLALHAIIQLSRQRGTESRHDDDCGLRTVQSLNAPLQKAAKSGIYSDDLWPMQLSGVEKSRTSLSARTTLVRCTFLHFGSWALILVFARSWSLAYGRQTSSVSKQAIEPPSCEPATTRVSVTLCFSPIASKQSLS